MWPPVVRPICIGAYHGLHIPLRTKMRSLQITCCRKGNYADTKWNWFFKHKTTNFIISRWVNLISLKWMVGGIDCDHFDGVHSFLILVIVINVMFRWKLQLSDCHENVLFKLKAFLKLFQWGCNSINDFIFIFSRVFYTFIKKGCLWCENFLKKNK